MTQNITKMETDAQITSMRAICGCDLTGQQWVVRQLRGTRPYLCNAIWRPRLARVSPARLASELRRYSAWKGGVSRLLFPGDPAHTGRECVRCRPLRSLTLRAASPCVHMQTLQCLFSVTPPHILLLSLHTHAASNGINELLLQRMLTNGNRDAFVTKWKSSGVSPARRSRFSARSTKVTEREKKGECGVMKMRLGERGIGLLTVRIQGGKTAASSGRRDRGVRRELLRCHGGHFAGILAGLVPVFTDCPFPR